MRTSARTSLDLASTAQGSRRRSSQAALSAAAFALALGLTACGAAAEEPALNSSAAAADQAQDVPDQDASGHGTSGQDASGHGTSDDAGDAPLRLADGWVKAAEDGMTAVFGSLHNASDADIHLTGASSPVAGHGELHETVSDDGGSSLMQEKEGGFLVPAGAVMEFAPGGDHIMLMDLHEPILPGDDVTITFHTDAGDIDITVVAKEFAGAQEEYVQDHEHHAGHGGEAHGGADHSH